MKPNIAGNNLVFISGLHLSTHLEVGALDVSYTSSFYKLFVLEMANNIRFCLNKRLIDEHGTILMIAPRTYGGVKHLTTLGIKPVISATNPNSSNVCHHYVESVNSILNLLIPELEKIGEELSKVESHSIDRMSKLKLPGNMNKTSFEDLKKKIRDSLEFCNEVLEGEDENK